MFSISHILVWSTAEREAAKVVRGAKGGEVEACCFRVQICDYSIVIKKYIRIYDYTIKSTRNLKGVGQGLLGGGTPSQMFFDFLFIMPFIISLKILSFRPTKIFLQQRKVELFQFFY